MIEMYEWENKGQALALQMLCVGKEIEKITLEDNKLILVFEDGTGLQFLDNGQSCCEERYFSCDGDDLSEFIGAKYIEAFVNTASNIQDEYGEHEVCFLEVRTSRGSITVSAHNEHNGYYGGFDIEVHGI